MIWKYVAAWVPMVFIAIANGALREYGYGRFVTELRAHQLSSIIIIVFFFIYIWVLGLLWRFESSRHALMIGFIWFGLTIFFEFIFGHYVARHSLSRLLHDYNFLAGRLWSFVLIFVLIAPYVIYRIQ